MLGDVTPRQIMEINDNLSRIVKALERIAKAAEINAGAAAKLKSNPSSPRRIPGR